jgi:hypothetical protein
VTLLLRMAHTTGSAMDISSGAMLDIGLKPLRAHTGFRVAYAEALGAELTAPGETGDPTARDEAQTLAGEVRGFLR